MHRQFKAISFVKIFAQFQEKLLYVLAAEEMKMNWKSFTNDARTFSASSRSFSRVSLVFPSRPRAFVA